MSHRSGLEEATWQILGFAGIMVGVGLWPLSALHWATGDPTTTPYAIMSAIGAMTGTILAAKAGYELGKNRTKAGA